MVTVLYLRLLQIFWSEMSELSTTHVESLQEFRHVLPARHLSYSIDNLHPDTTYLIQVVIRRSLTAASAFWRTLRYSSSER